ncbi:hypothetical protein D3C76_407030 [compost metagenome]
MNVPDLQHQITKRREWIKSLQDALPYADGPAYRQDLRTIAGYKQEITDLQRKIRDLGGDDVSNPL